MKSITIDISDKAYKAFKKLLNSLPKDSFQIYEDDEDELTVEEKKEIYSIKQKTNNNDFNDFMDWDDVKKDL